jgi:hypothetical protein
MPTHRRSLRAAIVALSLALPSALPAQQLAPGTRVRVKASNVVAPIIGAYQTMRRDTLVIMEEGEAAQLWSFSSSTVERFEVSAGLKGGNRRPITRWALIGAGVGAAVGFLAASALEGNSDSEYNDVLSAAVGAGIGAGVGAAYGWRVQEEHWTAVPLPRRVGLVPSRRGVRLAFGTSF